MRFFTLPVAKSGSQKPFLILPINQKEDDNYASSTERCFLSLSEEKTFKFNKNVFKGISDVWLVGSSYGYLVILDEKAIPLLLNPISGDRIRLPLIPKEFKQFVSESYFIENLRKNFIAKAVCHSSPSPCNYIVVIIYGCYYKLAYCMSEQDGWINLACANRAYTDIIFYSEKLYALANNGSVEAWDFRGKFPKKVMEIAPSFIIDEEEHMNFPFDKFSAQLYLVESKGEILLAKRYIGNFVNANGVALYEADLLTVDDTHPLVCPYRTKSFSLYKLDFIKIKWEKKESLDDQVLFLGGNHSMSLSARDFCNEYEANSIYFTDDKWDEMNEDYLYGGHDLGVFSFKDGKTKPLHLCEMDRIDPPPFWIVPIM